MKSTSSRILYSLPQALLTGVSAFVLATACIPSAQASSAPGAFMPASTWNVNRIDPANGSASYCTLVRNFTGNTVISFARNTAGEGTVAIDFQQPLFDTRQTYRIGLQAGEGTKREFLTRPATAGALVLRVGEDAAFFKALGSSTELGVIMDNTRYAFSLPDFGAGVTMLENCISTQVASPAVSAPKAAPTATTAQSSNLSAELNKLRTENEKLTQSLKAESQARSSTTNSAQTAELVARVQSLETEKNSLLERLQKTEQANQINDINALKSALDEQKNLREMLEAERAQRESLQEALKLKTTENAQTSELNARISSLESSNAQLKNLEASLAQAKKETATSLEEQERLRARLASVQTELDDSAAIITQERARREATEGTLREMQGQISTLQQQLNSARAENSNETELQTLKDELEKARTTAAGESSAFADAQTRLEAEISRREATERALSDMQKRLDSQDNSTDNQASLQAMQAELESIRKTQSIESRALSDALSRIDAETARRQASERTVADLQKQLKGASTEKTEQINARIAELETRNATLESRLKQAPQEGGVEAQNLSRQLDILRADNEQLAARLARMASQANQAPAAVSAARVVYAGDEAQVAQNLAETQASLEAALAERNEYRNLLQRERQRPDTAQSSKTSEGVNAHIAALESERSELIRQLEYERSRMSQIAAGTETPPSQREAQLAERLTSLEVEKANLEKQLRIVENDVIAARNLARTQTTTDADIAELLAENKRLQQELSAGSRAGVSADVATLQSEIAALRAQNNVLNDEVSRRLAAAPVRAEIDNANAEAAQALSRVNARFEQAEAENIRLARELAKARTTQPASPAVSVPSQVYANAPEQMVVAQQITVEQPVPSAQIAAQTNASQTASQPVQPVAQTRIAQGHVSRPIVDAPIIEAQQNAAPQMQISPQAQYASAPQALQETYANIGPDGRLISNSLQRAGIPMVSGFEKISRVSTADFAAFRWDTGTVFGTAEQKMSHASGVNTAIQEYLEKTRNRCSGTYDESVTQSGNISTADVACIMPDGTGAGAAVVFFYRDGLFNVVAHEGTLDSFEQAMNTRDRLSSFLQTTQR